MPTYADLTLAQRAWLEANQNHRHQAALERLDEADDEVDQNPHIGYPIASGGTTRSYQCHAHDPHRTEVVIYYDLGVGNVPHITSNVAIYNGRYHPTLWQLRIGEFI